jgi:hypothetical protein
MSKKFAKLISEKQSLCRIEGKITKQELINIFLKANIQALYNSLADDIVLAKLLKPHHYRFEIQVHAQEVETK